MGKIANILLVLSNLLGTIFCGISAYFAMAIFYGWKPTGETPPVVGTGAASMNPYWPLIIFGVLGIASLTTTWIFMGKIINKRISLQKDILADNAKVGKATSIIQPVIATSPTPILAKPKKFYSDREKSDLADALRDLSKILNKDGPNIKQKAQRIIEEWGPRGMQDIAKKPPDIGATIDQLNEVGNLAATLYRDLFEDNGIIKKYQTYDDELCQILQVHKNPSNTSNQPLIELQSEINYFRNMLTPIKLAEKYNDKNLNTLMRANTSLSFNNFQHKINVFGTWIDDTKKHIAAFRNSQLN